jgi:hypothetical protein
MIKNQYNPVQAMGISALSSFNLSYIKQLCDYYNVQINFIIKPDQLQLRVYRIDKGTGTLSKSEKRVFKNQDIGKFSPSFLEMIIRNVISDWYPQGMMST